MMAVASASDTTNSPVETSTTASEAGESSPLPVKSTAAKVLTASPRRSDSSTAVPGVTTRVTPRGTSPFTWLASASCSQTATRNPA